jgi:hypothetical protein
LALDPFFNCPVGVTAPAGSGHPAQEDFVSQFVMSDLDESSLALACITDALFCSDVKAGVVLTGAQVAQAISDALRAHRNWNGLTRAVRAAFATSPAEAACRERWCHQVAKDALNWADTVLDCGDLLN